MVPLNLQEKTSCTKEGKTPLMYLELCACIHQKIYTYLKKFFTCTCIPVKGSNYADKQYGVTSGYDGSKNRE